MKKLIRIKYRTFGLAVISALVVFFILPHRLGQSQESESPGAVFMVTSNIDAGAGSLRQAITDANASAGTDTIQFAIGTGTAQINIDSALPVITGAVTIDGTTQPGFSGRPLIILRRNNAPTSANGLQISSGGSTVKGLAVIRFSNGIVFEGAGGNSITGSFIGIDPRDEATNLSSILANGILITNSPNNQIGGATAAMRNVIGRCPDGIEISGAGSTGNVVIGNYIGLRSNGVDVARNVNGVFIDGAPNNRIGGTTTGERNLISGNTDLTMQVDLFTGIQINGAAATGNMVHGNYIGTDVSGTLGRPNSFGVLISGAPGNTIGGATATTPGGGCTGACNLIAGNRREGIQIGFGSAVANGNIIEGNMINLDASGTAMLVAPSPGPGHSIHVQNASNTRIGGTTPSARNVIVSTANNVNIVNSGSCVVSGNFIGTDTTGTVALGNATAGITTGNVPGGTTNASLIRIGGMTTGERNIISGGNQTGIRLGGSFNTVEGNYIGTDATGMLDLGNSIDGINITTNSHTIGTPTGTTIGGPCTGGCNVISGNGRDGVRFEGLSSNNSSNRVDYNYIGLNAAGTASLLNSGDAISIRGFSNNNIIGRLPSPATPMPQETAISGSPSGSGTCIQGAGGDTITLLGPPTVGTQMVGRTSRGNVVLDTVELVQPNFVLGTTYVQGRENIVMYLDNGENKGTGSFQPEFGTRVYITKGVLTNVSCTPQAQPGDLLVNGFIRVLGPIDNTPGNNFLGSFLMNGQANGLLSLDQAYFGIDIDRGVGNTINRILSFQKPDPVSNQFFPAINLNEGSRNRFQFQWSVSLHRLDLFPPPSGNETIQIAPGANDGVRSPVIDSFTLNPDGSTRLIISHDNPREFQWDLYGVRQSIDTVAFERKLFLDFLLSGRFAHRQQDRAIADVTFTPSDSIGLLDGITEYRATVTEVFNQSPLDLLSPLGQATGSSSELSAVRAAPGVTISGRVTTPDDRGLRNARVSIIDTISGIRRTASTSSFGLYSFDDIPIFRNYTISVSSKRYRFAPRILRVDDNLADVNFTGLE